MGPIITCSLFEPMLNDDEYDRADSEEGTVAQNFEKSVPESDEARPSHRIWQRDDIVARILQVVGEDQDQDLRRKALASLARTCRIFYEPAMNKLWSALDDISPIIRCMPQSAWRMSFMPLGRGRKAPCLYLTQSLQPTDWRNLAKHAHRVKHLSLGSTGSPPLLLSGWLLSGFCAYVHERATSLGGSYSPLFPNLQSFSCEIGQDATVLSCIPLLFGRSLTQLVLRLTGSPSQVQLNTTTLSKLLLQLPDAAPSLISLKFQCVPGARSTESLAQDLSTSLRLFPVDRLQTFQVDFSVSSAVLRHLTRATCLRDLRIFVDAPSDDGGRTAPDDLLNLPALERLTIVSADVQRTSDFATALRAENLKHLDVVLAPGWTNAQMQQLCTNISRQDQLQRLNIVFAGGSSENSECDPTANWLDFRNAMSPLLGLKMLCAFGLAGNVLVTISNDTFFSLGAAWPQLRQLVLTTEDHRREASLRPSLLVLQKLPQCFPHLLLLHMSFDTNVSPTDLATFRRASAISGRHPLTYLRFNNGPFQSTSREAGISDVILHDMVFALFPCLNSLHYPIQDGR